VRNDRHYRHIAPARRLPPEFHDRGNVAAAGGREDGGRPGMTGSEAMVDGTLILEAIA
jgi:hypothetical protein